MDDPRITNHFERLWETTRLEFGGSMIVRSPLFIPGNRCDMLEKAITLAPDAYVPDLEDSVPLSEKENARSVTASFLPRLVATGRPVIPRINSLGTGLIDSDLEEMVGPGTFGVSVGKVGSAQDIIRISTKIGRLEKKFGLNPGCIKIIPWIETAKAIINAYQICSASPRVFGVGFGAEDFTSDMGVPRTGDDSEVVYPRSAVCVAARAADVLAFDTPYFGLQDPDGLRQNALEARKYGFRGKFAIHPTQIEIINEAFSPSSSEVEYARKVIAVAEEAQRTGKGATSLDGRVIDAPVVERARKLLKVDEASSR